MTDSLGRQRIDLIQRATLERVARMYRTRTAAALAIGISGGALLRALRREGIVPRWAKR